MSHLLTAFVLLACLLSAPVLAGQAQPNIILIVADYMGYADTEPYGAEDIKTPAIAALANQGMRFSQIGLVEKSAAWLYPVFI